VNEGVMLGLGFLGVIVAGLLLTGGIRNRSIGEILGGITSAQPAESVGGGSGGASVSEPGATGAAASAPAAAGSVVGAKGTKGEIQRLVYNMSLALKWNPADWEYVIEKESGYNPAAVNPSSGATGLGQALGATKTTYPKMVSPDPRTQLEGMAEYINKRYGNPTKARQHEERYNWY
jgi:hypothetical protein